MPGRGTGAARWWTEKELAGPTRENETNPTITTTVSTLVKANPDRVGLVIVNVGANNVFIATTNSVSTTNGIRVSSNGGFTTMLVRDDFTLPAREWDAVTDTSTSQVYVLEVIADVILSQETDPNDPNALMAQPSFPINRRY